MKAVILTFVALVVTLLGVGVASAKPRTVSLRLGENKTVMKEKIKISFVEVIEDSRCPKGVNCVWAGNAKVKVTAAVGRGAAQTFEINSGTGVRGFTAGGYAFNFVSLTEKPAGMGKGTAVRPRLVLSIERLTR